MNFSRARIGSPWARTWFASSLSESAGVLISSGNLIKKVLFPAEILPIVTVLANMIHFFLGLPILAAFLIYYRAPLQIAELVWFPAIVAVQLVLTSGLSLVLAALTVHFRDIRDILANLSAWLIATPSTLTQDWALAALQSPLAAIRRPSPYMRERRDFMASAADELAPLGVERTDFGGTFYAPLAHAIAAHIPGARREIIPGAVHTTPITDPAAVAARIRTHLELPA